MKIALVSSRYDPNAGGMEQWTHRHAGLLLRDGHQVHVVAPEINDAPSGVQCTTVSAMPTGIGGKRLAIPERLNKLLPTLDVDVIHDMGVGWYCDLFMPHHGTRPAVFEQQTKLLGAPERFFRPLAFKTMPRYLRFKALERKQLGPNPDGRRKLILAVSDMVADQMKHFYHVPDEMIRVVYNGANIKRFCPADNDTSRKRNRHEIDVDDDTVLFLMVAHDWDLKGLFTVFQSLRVLKEKQVNAKLVIVGPGKVKGLKCWGIPLGKPYKRFPKLARQWNIEDSVIFAGGQDDPVPWYHAADAYVQPSLFDACSLVVLEAMACGLPCITSATNGASRLITNQDDGLVIDDPRSEPQLTRAMMHVMDRGVRNAMGVKARLLLEKHSEQHNYEQVLEIYEEIIRSRA